MQKIKGAILAETPLLGKAHNSESSQVSRGKNRLQTCGKYDKVNAQPTLLFPA